MERSCVARRSFRDERDAHGFAHTVESHVELDAAVVEQDDARADALDIVHVMRREQNRRAFAIEQLNGGLQKFAARRGIEAAGGFVEDEKLGAVADGAEAERPGGPAPC